MQVFHADSDLRHVLCQILRHPLGQRCDENLVMIARLFVHLGDQIIDLSLHRTDGNLRIQKSGGANDLLDTEQLMFILIDIRRCRHEQHLVNLALKLFEVQRTVVKGRRKTEPIIHQRSLSGTVTCIHSPHLGNRNMGLIHNNEKIVREEIHQGHRRCPFRHKVQMSGVVLNTGTEAGLPHHFDVEISPLRDTLCLNELVLPFEKADSLLQFLLYIITRSVDLILRNHIVGCRENNRVFQRTFDLSGQHIDFRNPIDLISEKFHPDGCIRTVCRENLQNISVYPEGSALKIQIIPTVLHIDQCPNHIISVLLHPRP